MINLVVFLTILTSLCHIIIAEDTRGADARSTDVHVGCFSGDSVVMLTNGEQKQIGYLQTGDKILSIKDLNILPSEMFIMLDKETTKQARFYTFNTKSGHQISLTGLHLIPVVYLNNTIDYIPVKNVKLGDRFYVRINNQLEYSSVVNITIEFKTGYYAPLTMTGTILVNDVFVSCFASVKNHQLAQIFMAPFRWYYQMTRFIYVVDPFDTNRTDGIHWLIEIIYQFINFIQPSVLQLL